MTQQHEQNTHQSKDKLSARIDSAAQQIADYKGLLPTSTPYQRRWIESRIDALEKGLYRG